MRATSILEAKTSEFLKQNLSFQNAHAYLLALTLDRTFRVILDRHTTFCKTVVIHFDGLENSLLCMYKAPICKLLLINQTPNYFLMNLSGNGQQEMLSPYVGTRQMTFLRGNKTAPIAGFELGIPDSTSLPPNQLSRSCYNPERGDSDHLD